MADINLTSAVDAAARAVYQASRVGISEPTPEWDQLTDLERTGIRESVVYIVSAAAPHIERQVRQRQRTVYSVQYWEDADVIRAAWVTGHGSYTCSRDDALTALRWNRTRYPNETFRLASARITKWKEETDDL